MDFVDTTSTPDGSAKGRHYNKQEGVSRQEELTNSRSVKTEGNSAGDKAVLGSSPHVVLNAGIVWHEQQVHDRNSRHMNQR